MTHYPVRDVARDKTREIPPSPVRLLPGSSRLSAGRRRGGGHQVQTAWVGRRFRRKPGWR